LEIHVCSTLSTEGIKHSLSWKVLLVLLVAFAGTFVAGIYAGTIPAIRGVLPANSQANSATIQPLSVPVVTNKNLSISGTVELGNVSTFQYKQVTIYIYLQATTCSVQSLYFNGYWKPDRSFPAFAGGLGLDPITLNQPGTVARTAPVAGSVLFVVLIPPNGTCSVTGLSISVYLQP